MTEDKTTAITSLKLNWHNLKMRMKTKYHNTRVWNLKKKNVRILMLLWHVWKWKRKQIVTIPMGLCKDSKIKKRTMSQYECYCENVWKWEIKQCHKVWKLERVFECHNINRATLK